MFLGYAVIGVPAFLFVKLLVPEAKGRSLEEIEADLQRKSSLRRPAARDRLSRKLDPSPEGRIGEFRAFRRD